MSAIPGTMRRPHEGRMILGVCAAIARRFDLDPTLVRVVAAIGLFVLTMPVIVAYAGLALVVPRDDGRMLIGGQPRDRRESIIGWAIVVLAAGLVIATPGVVWISGGADGWGIGMLVIAVAVIAWGMSRNDDPDAQAPAPGAAPDPVSSGAETAPTAVMTEAATTTELQPAAGRPSSPPPPQPSASMPRPPKQPSIFVPVAAAIVGLIGFTAVVVSVFDIAVTPVTVAVVAGFAAVAACGVAIAFFGKRGAVPLLAMGLLFAIVASVSAIGRDEFERGVGYRQVDVTSVSQLEQGFDHGVGFMEIDLRDVTLPPGETTMPVDIGWGAAEVRIPDDLRVIASGDNVSGDLSADSGSGAGSSAAAGSGTGSAGSRGFAGGNSAGSDDAPEEPPILVIESQVGVGAIEISRGAGHGWDRG